MKKLSSIPSSALLHNKKSLLSAAACTARRSRLSLWSFTGRGVAAASELAPTGQRTLCRGRLSLPVDSPFLFSALGSTALAISP